MHILCSIGLHRWDGCCCGRCGQKRDGIHAWDGCKCTKCGRTDLDFTAMTTNERLFVAGLLDDFDKAAIARDRRGLVELLEKVQVDLELACKIADAVLAKPNEQVKRATDPPSARRHALGK